MRIVLINLKRAVERRERMKAEFDALGLHYEIKDAKDGWKLSDAELACVDWDARKKLGLHPPARGSIANWLTQREAMRDLVENGPRMMAVFEDDARLAPDTLEVLAALEHRPDPFDLVSLFRGNLKGRFIATEALTNRYTLGRVKFCTTGSVGYVITRDAARHFLETTPRMVYAIDGALLRFWDNGLNVYFVDPPVILDGGEYDSQIKEDRDQAKRRRKKTEGTALTVVRKVTAGVPRTLRKQLAQRRLLRGEIGVTHR